MKSKTHDKPKDAEQKDSEPTFFERVIHGIATVVRRVASDVHTIIEDVREDIDAVVKSIVDIPPEEVWRRLEVAARCANQPLNWKTSIVDRLKLLNLPWDFNFRAGLAVDTGLVSRIEDYTGSEEQNVALLHAVNEKLSERGIKMPSAE